MPNVLLKEMPGGREVEGGSKASTGGEVGPEIRARKQQKSSESDFDSDIHVGSSPEELGECIRSAGS